MSKSLMRRNRVLASGFALSLLVVAACGSSKTASNTTAVTTTAASAATVAATTPPASSSPATSASQTSAPSTSASGTSAPTTNAPASGDPYIVYMLDSGNVGDLSKGVKAIEDGVNARGGLAGRPLKIVICTDKNDPNVSTQCAQKAVDDKAIAAIATTAAGGTQAYDIWKAAGIASVCDSYFGQDQFTAANAFPCNAGTFVPVAASAAAVTFFKQPNVLVTTIDVPAGRGFPPLINGVVAPVGGKVTAEVYIPFTATDLAPYAAQLVGQKGVLNEGNTVDIGIRLGKELLRQGFDQPVLYNGTTWDAKIISDNFGSPTNAYLDTGYDLDSAGYKMFDADMTKYAPDEPRRIGALLTPWLAANILANIAPHLPDISAKSILDYFNTTTSIDTFGVTTQPLNFTVPNKALGGAMARVSNAMVALYHFEDGKWVRKTDFADLLP